MAWGRETFDLELAEFYGQSEVNLVVGNSPRLFPVRAGSMGRAVPGHVVEVVDDAGNVLPAGEPGIVAVRRPDPVMFLEYWKRPRGDGREIPRRLVPARRRRRQGRGRLLLVPGPRRRHHQLVGLSHRPRRGGGMPRPGIRRWRSPA